MSELAQIGKTSAVMCQAAPVWPEGLCQWPKLKGPCGPKSCRGAWPEGLLVSELRLAVRIGEATAKRHATEVA